MTVTVMVSEWEKIPLVPVTLKLNEVPDRVPTKIVIVDMLEAPGAVGLGTKITAAPEGTLPLARVTLPVKPPRLVTVRRSDAEDPAGIDKDVVAALRLKSEVAVTVAP